MKSFKEYFLDEAKNKYFRDKDGKIFELTDESGQLFLVSINGMQKIKVNKNELKDYKEVKFDKKSNEYV